MLFCRKCGIDLLDDAKFCPECGTPIVKTSASQQEEKSSGDYSDKTQFRGKPQKYGVVSFENIPVGHIISERYEVKEKVGQGGFGAVYRCFDMNMNIDKALKVIPEAVSSDKEAMFDLQQEAQTMVALNHPNIVRVYDFHRSGTIKFIDMEFLDGKNLNEIKLEFSDKKIPEARVKEYALKIAEGMLYAHESGDNVILHKDLKPHNIRLTSKGVIKIMDFGIAETVRTSMSRLEQGSSSGTLHYMSPEQLRGRDIGREADVYSYGALLYELLNGQPPFYKGSIEHQIINEQPKPIEHVSAEMNSFLLKCLKKDYKNRYRNFNEIIKALHGESSLVSKVGVISSSIQSRAVKSEIEKLVEVSIKTNPPVAVIDIDGSILKYAPFKQKLTVGKHHLTVRKPGYRQVKSEIVITDSPRNDFFIELESIMGSITVETNEPYCGIILNKKEAGHKTPHTFTELLPNKKYFIQVKKEGYHSLPTIVTIKEKESKIIKFLNVSIKTNPDAAIVDIDNISGKQTPINLLLSPDKYQLKIRKEGYKPLETEITVSEDSSNEFNINLESIMGSITVETNEPCDIVLNKKETGYKTPHKFTELLPNNKYFVQVKKEGYHSLPTIVTIKEKESKIIKFLNVSIKTNPGAAAVDMVNILGKRTPVNLLLSPDKYQPRIRKEGYKLLETEITVSEDSNNDFHIDLEPVFGKLTVASEQAGMAIILNGSKTQFKTPHTFWGIIPQKKYQVELESNNYYSEPMTIMLNENEEKTVQPELIKISVVTIETAFQDIKFSLNGKNYSKTDILLLRKGKYILKPSRNYLPDLEMNIEKNKDLKVNYDKIVPKKKLLITTGKYEINAVYRYHDDSLSIPLKSNEKMELLRGEGTVTIENNILNKEYIADNKSEIKIDFLQEIDMVLAERKKKRLAIFKLLSPFVSIIVVIAFLMIFPYVKQERAWEKAQEIDTPQSYGDYLVSYPKGRYANEVFKRFPILEKMAYVLGGTFQMGRTKGSGDNDELPTHSVTLNPFYIGKYLVTQSEYAAVMGSNPAKNYGVGGNYPVYYVSWYSAIKFCNLLSMKEGLTPVYSISGSTNPANWGAVPTSRNSTWDKAVCNWNANGYRLPTEAEWEYAARGGTNTPDYRYSGSNFIRKVAWYWNNNSPEGTKPVGGKAPNGLGIYDMSGNLDEWCWDWYGSSYYSSSPSSNPRGPTNGSYRLQRGGYWNYNAVYCRVAYRLNANPYHSSNCIGFRLCRTFP